MAFIRIKQIGKRDGKKYSYAYLVENKWRKRGAKGSRQKVSQYLGPVLRIEKVKDIPFNEFYGISDYNEYLTNNLKGKIVADLIKHELTLRGFAFDGKDIMNLDKLHFNLSANKFVIQSKKKEDPIVLEINEGFLCSYTINRLLTFKQTDDERESGITLAKMFLESGLAVPKEIFIGYFEKS